MITTEGPPPPSWRHSAWITAGVLGLAVAIWLIPATIEIVDWPSDGPVRVALLVPGSRLLWLIAAALAASAALALWSRKTGRAAQAASAAAPLNLFWLWIVPYLPWLPDRAPILLVLAGPIRWVVAAVAVLVATRAAPRLQALVSDAGRLPGRRAVFVLTLVLYLILGLHSARRIGPGGDEPHYLVIAQSLVSDRDLKIENNHERADYDVFYPGKLRPDYLRRGKDGEIYSIHAPGLPALLLPAFAAAGYPGAVAIVCVMAALAALAVFDLAQALAGHRAALVAWAAVCLTVPFVPHAWLVYPEGPAMLVSAWGALWLWQPAAQSPRRWLWRGFVLGWLPWLHTKLVVLLAGLTVALWLRVWKRPRAWLCLLAPITASVAVWLASFYAIYGEVDPQAPYGIVARELTARNIPRGLLGLLFDSRFGLLFYNPAFLLAPVGAWFLFRRRDLRFLGAALVLVAAAFAATTTRLYMWWGGSSAPARFLVPILPCLAPMIALAAREARGPVFRAVLWVALSASLAIAAAGAVSPGRWFLFNRLDRPARLAEAIEAGSPLASSLPSFVGADWRRPLEKLAPWAVGGAVALAAMAAASRGNRRSTTFGLATVGGVSFLFAGALASASPPREARHEIANRGRSRLMARTDGDRLASFDCTRIRNVGTGELMRLSTLVFRSPGKGDAGDGGPRIASFSLPQGTYEARVSFRGRREREGEILVCAGEKAIFGRVSGVLPNPAVVRFELPVAVPSVDLTVRDETLAEAISHVEIGPLAIQPRSSRDGIAYRSIESIAGHPGAHVLYLDERTYPEIGTFWTRGTERGEILVAPAGAAKIVLTLRMGPGGGQVEIWVAGTESTVTLAAGETREVEVSAPSGLRMVPVGIRSSVRFRPADFGPSSLDRRQLGCHVTVGLL